MNSQIVDRPEKVLDLPVPGATFGIAVSRYFRKYAVFVGRASRSEYWWAYLFQCLVMLVPVGLFEVGIGLSAAWAARNPNLTNVGYDADGNQVTVATGSGVVHAPMAWMVFVGAGLMLVVWLALVIPTWALIWRRMHDSNHAGPLALLAFIPFVGGVVLLILALLPSDPAGARFDRRAGGF